MTTTCKYEDIKFVWISNHYDIHLSGLCRFDGKLHEFTVDYDTKKGVISSINMIEKIRWLISKKLFELCVGFHWTYPHRTNGVKYGERIPAWFWYFIVMLYYGVKGLWGQSKIGWLKRNLIKE